MLSQVWDLSYLLETHIVEEMKRKRTWEVEMPAGGAGSTMPQQCWPGALEPICPSETPHWAQWLGMHILAPLSPWVWAAQRGAL